jgi:hypothetical protein
MDKEIISLFREVLLTCDEMGLIGKEMFAVDGCKLSSNAAKGWSGTRADFKKKIKKLDKMIGDLISKHRDIDRRQDDKAFIEQEEKYLKKLQAKASKVRKWLSENEDKIGKSGKPIKSNITDNDSAKMKSSHGYVQGYDGVAMVDDKHQIIVSAEAFGQAQEHDLLEPLVKATRDNFQNIGKEEDVFEDTKLTADSGFHNANNMEMLAIEGIDAYVADNQFRKRDPRFADYDRFKIQHRKERAKSEGRKGLFSIKDFTFPEDLSYCLCPAGKRLYRSGSNVKVKNHIATKFKGPKSACVPCQLRRQCLRTPNKTEIRQVAYFHGRSEKGKDTFTERMKKKIDSIAGKLIYSKRMGAVEPVFADICYATGLDRFTLRSKPKVNVQWNLFCIVHNLKKIHQFGMQAA